VNAEDRSRVKAVASGQGGWGTVASAKDHERYALERPNRRRKCYCGCGGRATHSGCANGLALMSGCELYVRRWVRDGYMSGP